MDDAIGGYQNALRHGLWSAAIASEFGAEVASEITNAHEGISVNETATIDWTKQFNGDALLADSMVDFLNNQIGIEIGSENSGASVSKLAKLVLSEFAETGLWTATKDKDGNISIQRTQVTKEQERQGHKIIDNKLDENGRKRDGSSRKNR